MYRLKPVKLFLRYEAEVQRAAAELSKLSYQDGAFEEKEEIFTNLKHEVNAMRQQVSFKLTLSAIE